MRLGRESVPTRRTKGVSPSGKLIRLKGEPERPVRARRAEGDERERLWRRWAEVDEDLDAYAASRTADTPVVVFDAVNDTDSG